MKISLVIPAHNEEDCIALCLKSAIDNSDGRLHEIIVVDNASTDNTQKIASGFPGVKVVFEETKGLTCAREKGLKESTGEYVGYIDADTKMPAGWLKKAEKYLSKNEDIVCLSGPYRYYDGSLFLRLIMSMMWLSAPIASFIVGYAVLGGNFIAKRSALERMGGFDTSIDFFGEDTNIARRLSKFGKVLFKMDFYIYTSARRLKTEGLIKTNALYALNFLSEALLHKPITRRHFDIRG